MFDASMGDGPTDQGGKLYEALKKIDELKRVVEIQREALNRIKTAPVFEGTAYEISPQKVAQVALKNVAAILEGKGKE